jgi:hypothetical protein
MHRQRAEENSVRLARYSSEGKYRMPVSSESKRTVGISVMGTYGGRSIWIAGTDGFSLEVNGAFDLR